MLFVDWFVSKQLEYAGRLNQDNVIFIEFVYRLSVEVIAIICKHCDYQYRSVVHVWEICVLCIHFSLIE